MKKILFSVLVLISLVGCSTREIKSSIPYSSKIDMTNIYVARQPKDDRLCEKVIAQVLKDEGYNATYGELEDMPKDTTALVTYMDRWKVGGWYFSMLLTQINIVFRDPKDFYPIVSSAYYYVGGLSHIQKDVIEDGLDLALEEIRGEK